MAQRGQARRFSLYLCKAGKNLLFVDYTKDLLEEFMAVPFSGFFGS